MLELKLRMPLLLTMDHGGAVPLLESREGGRTGQLFTCLVTDIFHFSLATLITLHSNRGPTIDPFQDYITFGGGRRLF